TSAWRPKGASSGALQAFPKPPIQGQRRSRRVDLTSNCVLKCRCFPLANVDGPLHRAGFRLFWRWKSRRRTPAQDEVSPETKALIRQMAKANTSWGAPRIHGELLKLGIDIGERSVSRFMPPM